MKNNIRIIKKIVSISLSENKRYFICLLLIKVLSALIPIASLVNTQVIINNIQIQADFFSYIFLIPVFLMPFLNLVGSALNSAASYLGQRYTDILNYHFSVLQLNKLKKSELSDFENSKFYDLIQRAEAAGGIHPNKIIMNILVLVIQTISSIGFIIILVTWRWWTVFLIVFFSLLSSIQIAKINNSEHGVRYNRAKIERKSWYFAHLINKDENVKETILYSLQGYFIGEFKKIRKIFLLENRKMFRRRSFYTFFIQVVSIISTSLILFILFYEATTGALLVGSVMMYINSLTNVKDSFNGIVRSLFDLHQDSLYAGNIIELLEYTSVGRTEDLMLENKHLIWEISSIELVNLSYKYASAQNYALKNINLKLTAKENCFIVGRNGSGKSTLAKILLGFYTDYEGLVLVNGTNLREIDISSYKACLSAVFQDFAKYQLTVKKSVGIHDGGNECELKVIKSVENAGAKTFVEMLPSKYNQQIGYWFDDGIQLSGGELQKLAIARAFYREESTLILLDEPTSALDPISEKDLYSKFNKLSKGKIGVFITHRLKGFNFDGRIVVIANGAIVEQGEQKELLERESYFYELYTAQNNVESFN